MSKRDNFTAGRIAAFKCEPGKNQSIYRDGKTPGLGLRVTPAGVKSYIFETRLNGKTLRVTIGDTRTWTLDKAQEEATSLKAMTDKGIDPRQAKAEKLAEAEAKREYTHNAEAPAMEAWQAYITARQSKWSPSHRKDHVTVSKKGGEVRTRGKRPGESNKTKPGALLPLLMQPLANIDANNVRAWLRDEAHTRPTHARLAFGLLRAFLNWCADQPEYRAHTNISACSSRLPRDELPKKAAKNDCLQREQLPFWFMHVLRISNPVIAAYLQITLLTGRRREQIARLQWGDIDFRWKTIRMIDKTEGETAVPLTPYMAYLLHDLKRRNDTPPPEYRILNGKRVKIDLENWAPSPWVFASKAAKSGYLQEPTKQLKAANKRAGIEGLTIHGLRRSFSTLSEWLECPAGIAAQIQGHAPSGTREKHYIRRPIDLLRMWHTKIEEWILEQAGVEFVPEQTGLSLVKKSSA